MGKPNATGRIERLYALVANEEDARLCADIPDKACAYVPRNFFTIILASSLTKLGDALASPKTVLAWLLAFVHAPLAMTAFLVPIRESGSMVPQLVIASYVRLLAVRKWVWVAGSVLQAAAVAGMGLAAATLTGAAAGWAIVGGLVAFSLARGFCSVSSKDVLGKTIPKTRRGRLNGLSTSVAGVLTVGVGMFLVVRGDATASPYFYGALLAAAAGLWLLAALTYSLVIEGPGATEGGTNALREAVKRLDLLRTDRVLRRFILTRALLLCSALSAPYYVVLAQEASPGGVVSLGLFVLANGVASSLSAAVWGYFADVSSRRVLIVAATLAAGLGVVVFLIDCWLPSVGAMVWVYPTAFLLLGVAHSGVRAGRKTYIVDIAAGSRRTDYVAVSNTVIGVILLLTGVIGALSTFLSPAGIILVLSLFGFLGAILGRALPEA